MVRIGVVGAGIVGLSSAVKIKEKFRNLEVVLISKEFSPYTTSDGAAGLWFPYLCGNTTSDKLTHWGIETYKFIHKLWLEGTDGICLLPGYFLYKSQDSIKLPEWRHKVFGFHLLSEKQLLHLNDLFSRSYGFGFCFTTLTAEPITLLPYLLKRFVFAGGIIKETTIHSFEDKLLDEFDVIVNCTGLGAKFLVPDPTVCPIRGQVVRAKATWINEVISEETGYNYIIPNINSCVLGGTHQENDFNTIVDKTDIDIILNGCKVLSPGLKHAEILKHWVGLRPGRCEVRLESENVDGKLIIHNYGHGGSGITLFWGCATDTLKLLEHNLAFVGKDQLNKRSKL